MAEYLSARLHSGGLFGSRDGPTYQTMEVPAQLSVSRSAPSPAAPAAPPPSNPKPERKAVPQSEWSFATDDPAEQQRLATLATRHGRQAVIDAFRKYPSNVLALEAVAKAMPWFDASLVGFVEDELEPIKTIPFVKGSK